MATVREIKTIGDVESPDCRSCARPIRAICETLAEEIVQERRALASAPAHQQAKRRADLEVSERAQAQLWQACPQPQFRGRDQPLAGLPRPRFLN